jgi:hypothetical protein
MFTTVMGLGDSEKGGPVMIKLCGFCKFHECMNYNGLACRRKVKINEVENWFVACRESFRDRREHGSQLKTGPERRRTEHLKVNV